MLVIYIAGPYRAASSWEREQNIRRAEEVAYHVWEAGHVALCPHTNSRWEYARVPDAHWLAGTMELMRRCDGLLVVPHKGFSHGTHAEILWAETWNKPVLRLDKISAFCIKQQIRQLEAIK